MTKGYAQFASTTLVINDLEKCAAFYKSVCGLTEVARLTAKVGGRDIAEILFNFRGEGAATFVLLKYLGEPAPAIGETINVFATEDMESFIERATQHGAVIVDTPSYNAEYGVTSAFIQDPEGHLIGVYEPPSLADHKHSDEGSIVDAVS